MGWFKRRVLHKRIKERFTNDKILFHIFGGFALLCIVMIPLLSTLFFHVFQDTLQDQIYSSQLSRLQMMAKSVDLRADHANFMMQEARRNKKIADLFTQKPDNALKSLEELSEFRMGSRHIHSIYLYNEYQDVIYSSSGLTSLGSNSLEQFPDQEFAEMLRTIDQYKKYTPVHRRIVDIKPNGYEVEADVYTYFLYDTYGSGKPHNIIAFNFYLDWMATTVESVWDADPSQIYVVSEDGTVIFSDDKYVLGTKFDEEKMPADILQERSGYRHVTLDGKKYMLVFASPERYGYEQWTFLTYFDFEELRAPLSALRFVSWVIGFAFLAVFLGIAAYLARRIYLPVKKTINQAEALIEQKQEMLEKERREVYQRLFRGELPDNTVEIEKIMRQYDIELDAEKDNCAFVFAMDRLETYLHRYRKEMHKTNAWVEDLIRQAMDKEFKEFIVVMMQNGVWAVSVVIEGYDHYILQLGRVYVEVNEALMEEQLSMSMGVSDQGHSMCDIPYLYMQARDLLGYRFLLGMNQMITPSRTKNLGNGKYRYPRETEHRMLSALFSGKKQEAQAAFEQFLQEISTFGVQDMRVAFMLLANAMKRSANDTIVEVSGVFLEMDKFYQKIQTYETLGGVRKLFTDLIDEIAAKIQEIALQRHKQTVSKIQEYVEENYGCATLSMNEIADLMDMSPAYLSRLFKQVTEETFTEYLSRFRLEKACDALRYTDKTVNRISAETGFTNSSYFYVVFKKNLGITPSQFRQQNGIVDETPDPVE